MDPLPTPLDEELVTPVLLRLKTAPICMYSIAVCICIMLYIHNIRTYMQEYEPCKMINPINKVRFKKST